MRNVIHFFLLSVLLSTFSLSLFGEETFILVSVTDSLPPTVQLLSGGQPLSGIHVDQGILFFAPSSPNPEQWVLVHGEVPSPQNLKSDQLRITGAGRSRTSLGAIADSIPAQTFQLEQLLAFTQNRNIPDYSVSVIFSPSDGSVLLNPQPTLRRLPATEESTGVKSLPPVLVGLFRGEQLLLEIPFAKGQDTVTWREIPTLPESFKKGLPPGEYLLKMDGSDKVNRFTVKPTELRDWMTGRFAPIESLLGSDDPISVQIAVEMMAHDLIDGPFFTDALDRIDALPKERSTSYLENFRSFLAFRLSGQEGIVRGNDRQLLPDKQEQSKDAGAEAVEIHRLLLDEKWNVALKQLEQLEKKLQVSDNSVSMRELRALCRLYHGMILAESGVSRLQESIAKFSEAMQQLNTIAGESQENAGLVAASRFRTANNFGNFLLRLTQDRLYNHALAIATGDSAVLTGALMTWAQALNVYQRALSIAETSLTNEPELVATTKTNLARLYAVLADIVRTVDHAGAAGEIEKSALMVATALANEVIGMKLPNEERLKGATHHLLADIAFRQANMERCRTEATTARQCYVQTGTLSGVEAIERLLGMLESDDWEAALKHLTVSSAISEVMREQIPADQFGLSRAGFFARRAYVNGRMIEILLQEGKSIEALGILEATKGRSLQDVLHCNGMESDGESGNARPMEEILAHWPKKTVAIEYFVGNEYCWGFLIQNGIVKTFPIQDTSGKPVPSRELIAAVQHYLSDSELQAKKMSARVRSGAGFERDWETNLTQLRSWLIPDAILKKIREAKPDNLLIVPQHILHYLPFAALVVQPDKNADAKKMPLPTFLIDEAFDISYSPSLCVWDLLRQRENRPITHVCGVGISTFTQAAPLAGVKKDIENLKNAFPKNKVEVVMEDAATKSAVRDILGRRGLLLVGTHGSNNPTYPLHGFLLLRSGNGKDDSITAEDIFGTTVGTDLVILSACYSGLAEQSPMPGDDLFGIQRALLHGGCRAVITGIWDVYDSTGPVIIDQLLKRLATGLPVSSALCGAQRDFLQKQRAEGNSNPWTHPYFWAVYTLTGDGRVHYSP